MRNARSKIIFAQAALTAVLALFAGDAHAENLGQTITRLTESLDGFDSLLSMIAYISGLTMITSAIYKFQQYGENIGKPGPPPPPLSDCVKRFLAGGMMMAAPYIAEVTYNSTFGNGTSITNSGGNGGQVSGEGLDAMVVNFMTRVGGPTETLLSVFCYIFAVGFLLIGISRLTKRAEDGPRGPAGMGTIMTFITAGALFAFGDMMGSFSTSLFGDAELATRANITMAGVSNEDAQRIAKVIEGVMSFIMIVGFIAFIRGWFVLRAFADGGQQATMAQGLTFLFGGALAINLGELVNILQETVGVNGLSFT